MWIAAANMGIGALLAVQDADRKGLLRSATWLFLGLIAIAVVGVAMVWLAASSMRRERAKRARARRRVIPSAWEEAGRRAQSDPDEVIEGEPEDES